ncbi:trp operon leader peptide [Citrobacter werkmanii]
MKATFVVHGWWRTS